MLANDGDFAGALIKFQSSYDASKDPRVLWNVAFCQKNLRHYAKVAAVLRQYLAEGGALLSVSDRKDAQDLIAAIEPFTTRMTVTVGQPGAQIIVDDEVVGTSPLVGPVVLDIGDRRLRVTKDGFLPFERTLVVVGAQDLTMDVPLEPDVHEGWLVVEAPPNAAVFLDDKQIGVGRVTQKVSSGGHQLRVTAPGMRSYRSELIVRDKETRSIDVVLEAGTPAEQHVPALRLAVGCADPEARGPEDGLIVNADGPEVLTPGAIKRRWSDEAGRSIVEHAEYPIAPGRHRIHVGISDCEPSELNVDVDPVNGADVAGTLETSGSLLHGPQGWPGRWRVGLGLWLGDGQLNVNLPETYKSKGGPSVAGVVLTLGLQGRWFALNLDGTYGGGTFGRDTFNSSTPVLETVPVTWKELLIRGGPRLPLGRASFGVGGLVGIEMIDAGAAHLSKGAWGAYAETDWQPLCDWGVFSTVTLINNPDSSAPSPPQIRDSGPLGTLQLGVFYAPNPRCQSARDSLGLWQVQTAVGTATPLVGEPLDQTRHNQGRRWRSDGVAMMITGAVLVGLGIEAGIFAHLNAESVTSQYQPGISQTGNVLESVGIGLDIAGAVAIAAGLGSYIHGWRLGAAPTESALDLHSVDAEVKGTRP